MGKRPLWLGVTREGPPEDVAFVLNQRTERWTSLPLPNDTTLSHNMCMEPLLNPKGHSVRVLSIHLELLRNF